MINRTMGPAEWAMLILLSIVWGGSFFFYAIAIQGLPTFTIVFLRVSLGSIGLGNIGFGHGAGLGLKEGFGNGVGRLSGTRATKDPPRMRQGDSIVTGRLPPEVVQRIVRQNFGRFRLCYEGGLAQNPNLTGRVAVRFAISGDGSVSTAQNGGSDLPDSKVIGCVVSAFYGLSFPKPENGIVTVTYPIMFSPG